jgi:hypothetical protein
MYGDGEVIGQVGDVYDDFCIVAQVRFRSKKHGFYPHSVPGRMLVGAGLG